MALYTEAAVRANLRNRGGTPGVLPGLRGII